MIRTAALILVVSACSTSSPSHQPPPGNLPVIGACSFASLHGQFLVAENGGGGVVGATSATVGASETFDLELVDASDLVDGTHVHVRTADGHYLTTAGQSLDATATIATTTETFAI